MLHATYMLKTQFSIVRLLASTGAATVIDASFEIEVIIASKSSIVAGIFLTAEEERPFISCQDFIVIPILLHLKSLNFKP